jgi:hypothetical protein
MKRQRPQTLPFPSAGCGSLRRFGAAFVAPLVVVLLIAVVPSAEAAESGAVAAARSEDGQKTLQTNEGAAGGEGETDVAPETAAEHVTLIAPGLSPLLTLAAIEEAWNAGCADSIVGFFPEENITLHLETNVPEEGVFSRQQAAYILKDALCYTVTVSFEFLQFKYDKDGDEPPSAEAEWSYRREPEGELSTETVHLTLRKDGDRWLISGIRIMD